MTPTQARLHHARAERLARMAAAAERRKPLPISEEAPKTVEDWASRQKRMWFSIVGEGPRHPTIAAIQRAVAARYGVTVDELTSHRRTGKLVLPRQVAMYLAKMLTQRTLPEIGRRFDGRDHTTVLHGIRKIERLIGTDTDLAQLVAELSTDLRGEAG